MLGEEETNSSLSFLQAAATKPVSIKWYKGRVLAACKVFFRSEFEQTTTADHLDRIIYHEANEVNKPP